MDWNAISDCDKGCITNKMGLVSDIKVNIWQLRLCSTDLTMTKGI